MKKSLVFISLIAGFSQAALANSAELLNSDIDVNGSSIKANETRLARSQSSAHNRLTSTAVSSNSRAGTSELITIDTGGVSINTRQAAKKSRPLMLTQKTQSPKLRSAQPEMSKSAFGFSFYSASSELNIDLDNDGYYSDFTLSFDADFEDGSADVYAVIYYSLNNSDWTELAETEVFNIYLDEASDEYSLITTLNFGYPTGDYDILIDLYEAGVSGIVATISSDDVDSLYQLPLEDEEHEVLENFSQISFVATDLFGDVDRDGFYTDLTLEYDIDAQYSGDVVYAEVIMINVAAGWQQRLTSSDFVLGNNTEFVDLTFNSGYPAGLYDVRINLVNAFTGELIADAGREFSSLNGLPIESVNNDDFYDDLNPEVDVRVSGSGSLGWGLLLLIGLTLIRLNHARPAKIANFR